MSSTENPQHQRDTPCPDPESSSFQGLSQRMAAVTAESVREAFDQAGFPTLIVLDDDPTGTQPVADLPVITRWESEDLEWALGTGAQAIYVLTNSRAMQPAEARAVNQEVVRAALTVARSLSKEVTFVSRSDSTLRGHFPLEPDTIKEEIGGVDGVLIVPAFPDAGRVTMNGIHYCHDAYGTLIPVNESPYAKDNTFGFRHARLADWVEEKTGGETKAQDVVHIDRATLYEPDHLDRVLGGATDGVYLTADIECEADLHALAHGVIRAYQAGKRFIHRVGPTYVRALIGMAPPPVVTPDQLAQRLRPATRPFGLVVVGSHVPVTTRQLNWLVTHQPVVEVELNVPRLLDDPEPVIADGVAQICEGLDSATVVVHTSRDVVTGQDETESLAIATKVNAALVETIRQAVALAPPRFVIAKGGITSSDVAKVSLGIRRAKVVGPMEPGIISLWLAEDGPGAGLPYVVFAGNVGKDVSLADAVTVLSTSPEAT